MVVDKNSDFGSINFLDKCYNLTVSEDNAQEFLNNSARVEEKIESAVEKYLILTDSDQKEEIKNSFSEFIDANSVETEKIDSLENISKVAFQRLSQYCKDCYMAKLSNADTINIENLKNIVDKVKRDYELIMNLY